MSSEIWYRKRHLIVFLANSAKGDNWVLDFQDCMFFPIRADPFSEGPSVLEHKQETTKLISLVRNGRKLTKYINFLSNEIILEIAFFSL